MTKYWINTISLSHVQRGVEQGFTQANHGRNTNLKKMSKGDWVVFYSPKTDYPDGDAIQQFTALGRVIDDEPYQVEQTLEFHPYRRNLEFVDVKPASIRPMIEGLGFITDPKRWGYPFRAGLFEIPAEDFERIKRALL